MILHPWSHATSAGFTLRGWHTAPSGRPLLHFLHGNGFCGRTYEPLLRALAADFDLWLCDVQGHGDSDHGGRFLGWNRTAELALEAFQAGFGRFGQVPRHACGHSFGGVLSCLILAGEPALFQRAVLLDPVLFGRAMIGMLGFAEFFGLQRFNTLARQSATRRRHWPDRASAYACLHGRGVFRGWSDAALRAYVRHALKEAADGGIELKCPPSREVEIFNSCPRRLWSALAGVRTPTLLLNGQYSFPFIARSTARWCAMSSHVSARTLPGGHCFMQERPEESAERVAAFLLQEG
ncbi:alpha/beta fold hydrolase [Azotobacter chroococcum]|jgi:pimeloyl-ACP methyl ester carboxylesterase|uniref:Pimeloyl-ACP methyl ester carboxylesterase n=1 Tax=Azotobacter chroococcum TaxID=353 RepID=A0A4R1PKS2_9GAMM|nr:alpha/beta hydrolase [Azotobacter chroococcum]TBV98194.1 alpha/beta hydrolase [Azotobacter chroococcum]TCL28654.1 pimeloyl-ACP methyl ester carboxylesterase [Azotobacter chroococcum]